MAKSEEISEKAWRQQAWRQPGVINQHDVRLAIMYVIAYSTWQWRKRNQWRKRSIRRREKSNGEK